MRKLNRVLCIGLLTATVTIALPHWLAAQTIPGQQLSWREIFQKKPPLDEQAGGPRVPDSSFCAIAPEPTDTNTEVWSDRPLFVWQGNSSKIGVRPHNGKAIIWSETVPATATDKRATYTGEPLQPGQTYDWVILSQEDKPLFFVPFKVMEAQKRDRIKADLMSLEEKLNENRATPEQIARARANYFAEQQLWADVLQEIYSVKNPSEELKAILNEITSQICSPK